MFKSCRVFRVGEGAQLDLGKLNDLLGQERFQPCGASEAARVGFVSGPGLEPDMLAVVSGDVAVFWFQEEVKIVPPSAVKRQAEERGRAIEEAQGFRLGRLQKKEVKEAVFDELLAKALSRIKVTPLLLDMKEGFFYIGATSQAIVDAVTTSLVRAAGDMLAIKPVETEVSLSAGMTRWLLDSPPPGFTVDRDCAFEGIEQAKVRFQNHSLEGQAQRHIEEGKKPVLLGLTFEDRVSFSLCDGFVLRKISQLTTNEPGAEPGNAAATIAADAVLISADLAGALKGVLADLAGEEVK